MKTYLKWTGGMKLTSEASGNTIEMDAKAPIGHGQAMTPKELVASGLGGCTAMDVLAWLKKHKQSYETFEVSVDTTSSEGGYPVVFKKAVVTFLLTGNVDKNIYIEAVKLSQTKYCSVSAMLVKAFPIEYIVVLNGEKISEGLAQFDT